MKHLLITLPLISLCGCTTMTDLLVEQPPGECPGNPELPAKLAASFEPVEDKALLSAALGAPKQGGLCQGKVYKSKEDVEITLYRAWNSTDLKGRLGKWWAFDRPDGKISKYRSDYAICYERSPLDKLTHCNLKAGAKLVIGTGQSARCSQYLTYPPSEAKKVYLENASESVSGCRDYDARFSWEPPVKDFLALPKVQ
ncbi:hypothetical protein [Candidatus Thiosymbion oneisti]|uniref:hypothetical protein n=1 Tax=Candidatus Thiosymbion oneisti TaxID=589554 RepID=UPI00105F6195|nr:hypothetical protein [Candidatus Thiosymbion oneisti]